ncbi:MAG: methionyl-tRNA formyltransferase [Nitrospirae bacterium]|nr:methionyl-tRNA formyltransferase [Nitrospirota bacterium]
MRIIFFGTPQFAVPSLKALRDAGHDVRAVVTRPDRVKGRGHVMSAPPVKEFALSRGLSVMQPASVRTPSFYDDLAALSPEVIAVVAYGKIIPPDILRLPPMGCVNVHGSLLPRYRGAAPIQWAVINGDEKTGITTMLMDAGLDTGDILLQEETAIRDEDTAESLGLRLSGIGAALLVKTLEGLRDHTISPVPQEGEPSFCPPLKKDDGRIDWGRPSRRIFNLVRGAYPWPGAYASIKGERLTVLRSAVIDETSPADAGRISRISGGGIHVGTGQGTLSLLEVRPEGKKAMPAAAFSNGRRLKEGMYFDV